MKRDIKWLNVEIPVHFTKWDVDQRRSVDNVCGTENHFWIQLMLMSAVDLTAQRSVEVVHVALISVVLGFHLFKNVAVSPRC